MGFTRAELDSFRGKSIADILGPGLRMLIVGINPGLHTAAVQAPFSRRGNRFYPALYRAGITDRVIDASEGLRPEDREHLIERGLGLTTLVAGATARADELSTAELVAGGAALLVRLPSLHPRVVAMLGVTAYRTAFAQPRAVPGRQPVPLGGAELWVVPNPSGLNAHESVASLATAYREAAIAAGIDVYPQPPEPARQDG